MRKKHFYSHKSVVKFEKMQVDDARHADGVIEFFHYVFHDAIISHFSMTFNKKIYENAKNIDDYVNTRGDVRLYNIIVI